MTGDAERVSASPRVRVVRHWNGQTFETDEIVPANASAVFILWEGFPDVDGGVPARLVRPLAAALTDLGEVCFRVEDGVPVKTRRLGVVKQGRKLFARLWTVVGTHDAAASENLFDVGWSQGDQMAMIAPTQDIRVMAMLSARHSGTLTLAGDELIAAAAVDGAGMLLAATDRGRLEEAIASILRRCAENNVPGVRE